MTSVRSLGVRCLALLALGFPAAHADTQVLQGILGKTPITVELTLDDPNAVSGRYFYQKYHSDIALDGQLDASGTLRMSENQQYGDEQSQQPWTLHRNNDGSWSGNWQRKNQTLPIRLTPARQPALDEQEQASTYLNSLAKDSLYDLIRLADLAFTKGKTEKFMGYQLQWWTEPTSKISLFTWLSGPKGVDLTMLNQVLRDKQWQEVTSYFECMLGGSQTGGGDFEQTLKPMYFNTSVMSVSVFTSYFCGGAHPDFGDNPINLDVHTGKELTLEDVFWLGDGKPIHYNDRTYENFDEFSQYRSDVFAPWIMSYFSKLYPKDMGVNQAKSEDDCDYQDSDVWQFVPWYFTAKGLYISPYFARVARACEYPDWPYLPYSEVKKHPGDIALTLP